MSLPIPQKILIIGPSWVGDMVMAQSLFIALKQQYPQSQIDVLAPAWTRPLLVRMPEITEAIAMPVGHGSLQWGMRKQVARELRDKNYDQAILLPNSLKSALIPWLAKIPLRTGWKGEMRYGLLNDMRPLDKQRYPLMVERFTALAYPKNHDLPEPPKPSLRVEPESVPALLEKFGLNLDKPVLVLCPGAEFGPAKRWPESHYAAVAEQKIADGWQVWIMGSGKDQPVAQVIVEQLSEPDCAHVLAGHTELADAVDLMAQANAVISNDSGLMHIAAALNRPLVAIYGSTSPGFTPPLSEQVAIVSIPVDCGPCFQRECPQGHLKCLNDLSPSLVLEALTTISDSQPVQVMDT